MANQSSDTFITIAVEYSVEMLWLTAGGLTPNQPATLHQRHSARWLPLNSAESLYVTVSM